MDANESVLFTKPLASTAAEAKRILDMVESNRIFAGRSCLLS